MSVMNTNVGGTTPADNGTTGTTSNTYSVTLHAQDAFETAVGDLTRIVSTVFDSQSQLTTSGMVTTAGQKFGSVVVEWCNDFEDMRNTLNWMATQLGDTAAALARSDQQGAEMAAQLPGFGSNF
jgi:hypothetical protein